MVRKSKNDIEEFPEIPDTLEIIGAKRTYTVKVPTGDIGWQHLLLIMEVERAESLTEYEWIDNPDIEKLSVEEYEAIDDEIKPPLKIQKALPNPAYEEVMKFIPGKWFKEILPSILVDPVEMKDIPWYDLLPIFYAVKQTVSVDMRKFRPTNQS